LVLDPPKVIAEFKKPKSVEQSNNEQNYLKPIVADTKDNKSENNNQQQLKNKSKISNPQNHHCPKKYRYSSTDDMKELLSNSKRLQLKPGLIQRTRDLISAGQLQQTRTGAQCRMRENDSYQNDSTIQ